MPETVSSYNGRMFVKCLNKAGERPERGGEYMIKAAAKSAKYEEKILRKSKILKSLGRQGVKDCSNDWEYVLTGLYVVNREKLEKTLTLEKIIADINQYYAMSPLINSKFAQEILATYRIQAFDNHVGIGFTLQEFYSIISKQLLDIAGFSRKEKANVEKIERTLDFLGWAPDGNTEHLPVTHINKNKKNATLEEKMQTPVMIGDLLNILGYYVNKVGNSEKPTVKRFYKRVIKRLGKRCNLIDSEIDNIINSAIKAKKMINAVNHK